MSATPPDSLAVSFSIRFYQLLVHIYPASFRSSYGALMVQTFRDSCLRAVRSGEPFGLLFLWGRTCLDVLVSAIDEYSNRGVEMTKSKLIKISGWFLFASGFLFFLGWVAAFRPEYSEYNFASLPIDRYLKPAEYPLLISGILFTAIGIIGLIARFWQKAGELGRAGLGLSLVGTLSCLIGSVGLSIADSSPYWEMNLLGLAAVFLGFSLFGISCIQRKLLWQWNSLPFVMGLPVPLLLVADILLHSVLGTNIQTPWQIIAVVFLISFTGLILLGYLVQSEKQQAVSAAA